MSKIKYRNGGGFVEAFDFTQVNGKIEEFEERIASLEESRDSLSQQVDLLEDDTGWVDVWVDSTMDIRCRRIGRVVVVEGASNGGKTVNTDWTDVTTLPSGMRPDRQQTSTGYRISTTAAGTVGVRLQPSGLIAMIAPGDSANYWYFHMVFFASQESTPTAQ